MRGSLHNDFKNLYQLKIFKLKTFYQALKLFYLFIYLKLIYLRERENKQGKGRERERESQALTWSSNSWTVKSWPELKSRAGCLTNWDTQALRTKVSLHLSSTMGHHTSNTPGSFLCNILEFWKWSSLYTWEDFP